MTSVQLAGLGKSVFRRWLSGQLAAGLEESFLSGAQTWGPLGRLEKMQKQLPTQQAIQMNFACGIPQRYGCGEPLGGALLLSPAPVCREGVAHSRGDWVEFVWPDRPREVSGTQKIALRCVLREATGEGP